MIAVNFTPAWKRFKAHYMVILLFVILSFGMVATTCSAANNTISDIDAALLSLPAGDAERIEVLTSLIAMYSEQLEEYDRSNGNFVVGCVGVAGVILGLVVTFFSNDNKGNKALRPNYGVALLFTLIPGIMTLCLYVLSMQCRRVEFFRGYLRYLEEKLGALIEIPMVFNRKVVGKFFSEFPTMQSGYMVMAVVAGLLLLGSCVLCLRIATPKGFLADFLSDSPAGSTFKSGFMAFLFFMIFIFLGAYCVVFILDLCANGEIAEQVYQYCLTFHG